MSTGGCDREAGSEGFTNTSSSVDVAGFLVVELEVPGRCPSVIVALLWLEVGLEEGRGEPSLLRLPGLDAPAAEPKLLATEFPRLRPGGACTLHLLLTLSDRFIMALCTKPPIPFVGEAGRSNLSGEIRPCEGDIAKPRVSAVESILGGSNLCALDDGIGDPKFPGRLPNTSELLEALPTVTLLLEGDRSEGLSVSFSDRDASRDIPGICTRAEFSP